MEDIPEELKAKLRILEKEINFRSLPPYDPGSPVWLVIYTVVLGAMIGWIVIAYKPSGRDDRLFLAIFLLQWLYTISQYRYQRRLFKLYSSACEIIEFYKRKNQ